MRAWVRTYGHESDQGWDDSGLHERDRLNQTF